MRRSASAPGVRVRDRLGEPSRPPGEQTKRVDDRKEGKGGTEESQGAPVPESVAACQFKGNIAERALEAIGE